MSDSVNKDSGIRQRHDRWGDAAADVARVLAARGVIPPVLDASWDALSATLSDPEMDLVSLVTEELYVPQRDGSQLLWTHPAPSTVIDLVVVLHAHRLGTVYDPQPRVTPEQGHLPFD